MFCLGRHHWSNVSHSPLLDTWSTSTPLASLSTSSSVNSVNVCELVTRASELVTKSTDTGQCSWILNNRSIRIAMLCVLTMFYTSAHISDTVQFTWWGNEHFLGHLTAGHICCTINRTALTWFNCIFFISENLASHCINEYKRCQKSIRFNSNKTAPLCLLVCCITFFGIVKKHV